MKGIKVSYIIITWNGIDYLRQLLESMRRQLSRPDVEVIITDNHSTDGTVAFLEESYPTVRLICLPENKGVAFARNTALREARGKYLLILDNDIQITDEAVAAMEDFMDAHEDVGICGCKLLYPDGAEQVSCKPYPGFWKKVRSICSSSAQNEYATEMRGKEPFEPTYIIGACQMIRQEVYQKIGELDEKIFYGPEDCDYCMRARSAGWRVLYIPTVHMYHHCQRRTHANPFSRLGWRHVKALMYFYRKYKRIS